MAFTQMLFSKVSTKIILHQLKTMVMRQLLRALKIKIIRFTLRGIIPNWASKVILMKKWKTEILDTDQAKSKFKSVTLTLELSKIWSKIQVLKLTFLMGSSLSRSQLPLILSDRDPRTMADRQIMKIENKKSLITFGSISKELLLQWKSTGTWE